MFLRPEPLSYAAFVAKRVCRIYLPYIVVVALAMLLMTVTAPHNSPELTEWFQTSCNRGTSRPLIVDHGLMLGGPNCNFVDNPIWSLVHEMRYSLIFPVMMWAAVMMLNWRLMIGASLLISVAATCTVDFLGNNSVVASLQYAFLFVTGAELARHRAEIATCFPTLASSLRILLGMTSLCLLSVQSLTHVPVRALRGFAYVAPDVGAVLLLVSIIGSTQVQKARQNKMCLWLGRVSYSLYLSHLVVLLTLVFTLHRIVPIQAILAAVPPIALVVAAVLYRWLEAPAIALGHGLRARIDRKIHSPAQGSRAAVPV
jgi:peptidoglycan/LPS O-acetylase OafA/YrhL